ncbi:MAG: helix-turn-helix domain-containing protein [Pseudomonadota bacterium]
MKSQTAEPSTKPAANVERIPLLYKISSVMALLEISHATVYRMVATGELELVKLSTRASRITSASVARILEKRN